MQVNENYGDRFRNTNFTLAPFDYLLGTCVTPIVRITSYGKTHSWPKTRRAVLLGGVEKKFVLCLVPPHAHPRY
jgi:hypothetical protein